MKILACILATIGGLLQLILGGILGIGMYVLDRSITQLFFSTPLVLTLSIAMAILGIIALKYPKTSGVALVIVSTVSFFLGSFLFAPIGFLGGEHCGKNLLCIVHKVKVKSENLKV